MKTHTVTTYSFDELEPSAQDQACENMRQWDLADYVVDEAIDSLKAFADHFDVLVDWSISQFPDRGEYITFTISDDDINLKGRDLEKHFKDQFSTYYNRFSKETGQLLDGDCPFTGVAWDETLLDPFRVFIGKPLLEVGDIAEYTNTTFKDLLDQCGDSLLNAIHAECEYIYSEENLRDYANNNEYEFTSDGNLWS